MNNIVCLKRVRKRVNKKRADYPDLYEYGFKNEYNLLIIFKNFSRSISFVLPLYCFMANNRKYLLSFLAILLINLSRSDPSILQS